MIAKQEIADLTAELIAWKMEANALRQEIVRLREWLNVALPGEAPKEQDGETA